MSSTGGNVEGYLLKLEEGSYEARVVYCILDEGILRYFSRKGGELLGAVPLTGSKVDVFMLPYDKSSLCSHQFRVDAQPRPAVSPTKGRSVQVPTPAQLRSKISITLAGSTKEVADQWAISILNWNRYSWDDPQTLCSSRDEYALLNEILNPSVVLSSDKHNNNFVPIGVSRAVQPL